MNRRGTRSQRGPARQQVRPALELAAPAMAAADGRLRGGQRGPPPGRITVAASSPDSVCVCIRRKGREGKCAGDGREGIRLGRWVPPQFGKICFEIYEKFVNNLKYISLVSAIHKNNLKAFLKKIGIYLYYLQITPPCLINYTEEIIVNLVIRQCKYS